MANEIKVGDKVRVSKDAPKLLFTRSICNHPEYVFEVRAIEEELADIYYGAGKIPLAAFVIPTKYLIKVDAEAKEPKFKVGDKVKDISSPHDSGIYKVDDIKKSSDGFLYHIQGLIGKSNVKESDLEPYAEPTAPTIKVGSEEWVDKQVWNYKLKQRGVIKRIANGCAEVFTQYGEHKVWSLVDLFDEYDEPFGKWKSVQPKESTEAEKKPNIGSIKIPVEVDLTDSYWDAYTADLAKEIAVKLSDLNENKPGYVADYAVSVAKAVVENLKKR